MDTDENHLSSPCSSSSGRTPRKAQWRSTSWTPRSSPRSVNRPSLLPLSISRPPALTFWPRPAPDDTPSTPSSSSSSPYICDGECSRVAEHVYLGSDAAARDRDCLRRHGITHVLNCVGASCPEYFRGELVYKTLWLRDSPGEDLASVLYDAFDYLEDARAGSPPGRVLVHCLRGASRSAAVVIAYLMWYHRWSFDDTLRHVRSARAVTDPNFGFASQLLQCQGRIHAMPPSPGSVVRGYRMAPQSPYDPLHLVAKAVERPSPGTLLDSRGAVILVVARDPNPAIFVWVGAACEHAMAARAVTAARQFVKYECARGLVVTVRDGEEPQEFWAALADADSTNESPRPREQPGFPRSRRVELYDLDFEIFRRALKGSVVPPAAMPGSAIETCLPARQRESGWSVLRRKFHTGGAKEIKPSTLDSSLIDEEPVSPPSSFMGEMSTTPTSTSADSASARSSFSPASSSSLDWFNLSSPASELYMSPPHPSFRLTPLCMSSKEKRKNALPPLAERRGSTTPSLMLSTVSIDEKDELSTCDLVMDWCLSPPFISELVEELGTLDFEQQSDDVLDEDDLSSVDDHALLVHPLLFHWPSRDQVEVLDPSALDSASVFLLVAPDSKPGTKRHKGNTLYLWIGRQSCLQGGRDSSGMSKEDDIDGKVDLDKIGVEFLDRMGLPMDTPIKIVKEGEEPEQFLNHLFSFHQAKESSFS